MAEAVTEVKEQVGIGTLDNMREYKEARKAGTLTVEKPAQAEPEKKADETEKKKSNGGGFQRKIDRLIKYAAEKDKEIEELKSKAKSTEQPKPETSDPEPKRADFQNDAEFNRALGKWDARQELRADKEREAKEAESSRLRETFETYNKAVIEAKTRYEDWSDVVDKSDIYIPQVVVMAVYEMENGPDVTYFLASHPEVCEELAAMSLIGAVRAAEKISIELAKENPPEEEDEDEEEKKPEKKEETPAKIVTKAPAPIKPVGTGATKSTVPLDKMDFQAYKQARKEKRVQ